MAHDPTRDEDSDRPPSGFWDAGRDRRPWWKRDLGNSPLVAVGMAIGTLVVVLVAVFALNRPAAAPPNVGVAPPAAPVPAGPVAGGGPVEAGAACTISNLRKSNGLVGGFGGLPGLTFDYAFAPGRPRPVAPVAVVTAPGQRPATANLVGAAFEDRGTVSLAPLDAFAEFPRGTTVYLGSLIDTDADGVPKRLSNVLKLE
jgi:hypothetical protein